MWQNKGGTERKRGAEALLVAKFERSVILLNQSYKPALAKQEVSGTPNIGVASILREFATRGGLHRGRY